MVQCEPSQAARNLEDLAMQALSRMPEDARLRVFRWALDRYPDAFFVPTSTTEIIRQMFRLAPRPLRTSEVQQRLGLTESHINSILSRLVAEGALVRVRRGRFVAVREVA